MKLMNENKWPNIKVNINTNASDVHISKQACWSPSPVDLSINTPITPPHLVQSLGSPLSSSTYSLSMLPGNSNGINTSNPLISSRKQREFIPDSQKDECYWDRRKRNNEAAKRSREKRRISDMVLESRVLELTRENTILKAELHAIKEKFRLPLNQHFVNPELLSITMPENGSRGRRNKLLNSLINGNYNGQNNITSSPTSPLATNGTSQNSTTSLPHKLRHKARNTPNDSDSGSDTNGNSSVDCSFNSLNIDDNNKLTNNQPSNDNNLQSENMALRKELQRLANEINSLKSYFVPSHLSSILSNDNSYNSIEINREMDSDE